MKHLIGLLLMIPFLTACGGADVAGDASDTVERYLQAKVTSNADVIGELLCSEMEAALPREVASFSSVTDARIENLACTQAGDLVSCEGTIVAQYGTQDEEFDLTSYRVVQEDGEWRWCGEAGS